MKRYLITAFIACALALVAAHSMAEAIADSLDNSANLIAEAGHVSYR